MNSNPLSPRSIQQRLMRLNRLHRATVEKRMSATGIHRSQHMILMYLNKCNNSVSQKEIATHFDISAAAVTGSLKKLEAGGYINRNCSENDNRFNEIEITQKGKEIVNFSHKVFESIDNAAFEGINDEEMKNLADLLDKILANLNDNYGKENDDE